MSTIKHYFGEEKIKRVVCLDHPFDFEVRSEDRRKYPVKNQKTYANS